jgi:hypothetical protein
MRKHLLATLVLACLTGVVLGGFTMQAQSCPHEGGGAGTHGGDPFAYDDCAGGICWVEACYAGSCPNAQAGYTCSAMAPDELCSDC